MTRDEARRYLETRLQKLDGTWHARWPRWTYADASAVQIILHEEPAPPRPGSDPC
jgi:hypothetical protein